MRYYSSTAGEMTLTAGVAAGDSSVQLDTVVGLPVSYPFTLFLDYGGAGEEIVEVTSGSGTTLTVTRGVDGTSAQAHALGAKVRHGMSARDLRESRQHEAATAAHGVTGAVVGTTDTQTLTNKTLNAPLLTGTAESDGDVVVKDGLSPAFAAGGASTRSTYGASAYVAQVDLSKSALKVFSNDSNSAPVVDLTSTGGAPTASVLKLTYAGNALAGDSTFEVGGSVGGVKYRRGDTGSGITEGQFDVRYDGSIRAQVQWGGFVSTGNPALDVQGGTTTIGGEGTDDIAVFRKNDGTVVASIDKDGAITSPTITALQAAETSGRATVTTDASGNAMIPHGLGVVPTVVYGAGEIVGTTPMIVNVYRAGTTSTNINFVCTTDTGSRWASQPVTINWIAKR